MPATMRNFPAFPPMLDLLRGFHEQTKPLLGLCLGSQLLARAFGEKVRRSDEFEVGYPTIEISRGRPEGSAADRPRAAPAHPAMARGHVRACRRARVHLMTGATIRNQAFRFGRTTYGFQCHFEVSPELAKQWFSQWGHTIVRRYEEQAGRAVLERAQGEIAHHGARAADFCRAVTQRWATLVQDARKARAA